MKSIQTVHIVIIIITIVIIYGVYTWYQDRIPLPNGVMKTTAGFQIMSSGNNDQQVSQRTVLGRYQLGLDLELMFTRFGVHAWAVGPTLLGIVRHGGLLPQQPDVYFAANKQDFPAWKNIVQSNSLAQYGYQFVEEGPDTMRIFLSVDPSVEAFLMWVEFPEEEQRLHKVCPSNTIGYVSNDEEACGFDLRTIASRLQNVVIGRANEVEPRRKLPFGTGQLSIPNHAHIILDRQEGTNWEIMQQKNGSIPVISDEKHSPMKPSDLQALPYYRVPETMQTEDYLPALPIGPVRPTDRGESWDGRNDPYRV